MSLMRRGVLGRMLPRPAEPMEVDEDQIVDVGNQLEGHMVENPALDVDHVAAQYTGVVRLERLMFIAKHCPVLKMEALQLTKNLVTATLNTDLFKTVHSMMQKTLTEKSDEPPEEGPAPSGSGTVLDEFWVESTNKKANDRLEKLKNELRIHKESAVKESIRLCLTELGNHYMECGNLEEAMEWYSLGCSYCNTPEQSVKIRLNVIKVGILLNRWRIVQTDVGKARYKLREMEMKDSRREFRQRALSQVNCAAGLVQLARGEYQMAANSFLQVKFLYSNFPEMLSQQDLASYTMLCAMATFNRREIDADILNNRAFKPFMELDPHLREAVKCFYLVKHNKCMKCLADIKDNLLLDMHLAPHVKVLYKLIWSKALSQYFSPYKTADMHKMAKAFDITVDALQEEVEVLIANEDIDARIDSQNKVLHARDIDPRVSVFENTLALGRDFLRQSKVFFSFVCVDPRPVYP
ncbi:hypothetical protein ACOMHN_001391 [Nucella lapillus]